MRAIARLQQQGEPPWTDRPIHRIHPFHLIRRIHLSLSRVAVVTDTHTATRRADMQGSLASHRPPRVVVAAHLVPETVRDLALAEMVFDFRIRSTSFSDRPKAWWAGSLDL